MWSACFLAAISSVTYPAISSFISIHSDVDKQGFSYLNLFITGRKTVTYGLFCLGVVQGVVTGVRGLCGGLGPAMFGFIFYLFNVNLNEGMQIAHTTHNSLNSSIVIKHLKYNVHNDPSTTVNVTE